MSGMSDRIELLDTFVRIAETGGVGAAARSYDISNPTVSRRLQQLEGLLETRLLERGANGSNLTPAGARLLPEAREIVARWRDMLSCADPGDETIAGAVRISASSDIGAELLPDILSRFLQQHPNTEIDLRLSDGPIDLVGDGLDFAVRVGKPGGDVGVVKRIARVRNVLVASPAMADALGRQQGVSPTRCEPLALEGAPFIGVSGLHEATVRFQGRGEETLDVRFDRIAVVDHLTPAIKLAAAGHGLALLPSWAARPRIASGALVQLAQEWSADDRPVSLLWMSERFRSAAASALLETVWKELPLLLQDDATDM